MRIVAGELRGRALKAPRGLETRPMLARVREAIFNILARRTPGARVADLFAGTGVVGLEALSRGAAHVDFFESGRDALRALNANLDALGVRARATVHRAPLPRSIAPGPPWDLVFVDPPWGRELGWPALEAVLAARRLAEGGRLVLRERLGLQGGAPVWAARGLDVVDERHYGDSAVLFLAPLGAG